MDIRLLIEQETSLEIALVFMLAAESGAGEIGRADEGDDVVNDDGLSMYPRAQDTLEQLTLHQFVEAIEIFTESWPRLLAR